MEKVKFVMLCGLPASGKSTYCKQYEHNKNWTVSSSDEIRAELGNVNDQTKNDLVFNILHNRIKEGLRNGKNVCYDATNLSRKRRIHFLSNELRDIPCKKVCVLFATPYEVCLKNNANRERKVPEDVIDRMIKGFEVPCRQEGWDDIQIVWWDWNKDGIRFDIFSDMMEWCKISHNNPHHTLNIGDHMLAAYKHYINGTEEIDELLADSILLHDCGKIETKDFHNNKGESCETAHFYQHHLFSSYKSLFYMKDNRDYTDEEILHIALLIGLHMQPFLSWRQSEKAKEKDRRLFGDDIIKDIEKLHECDLAAH